LYNA